MSQLPIVGDLYNTFRHTGPHQWSWWMAALLGAHLIASVCNLRIQQPGIGIFKGLAYRLPMCLVVALAITAGILTLWEGKGELKPHNSLLTACILAALGGIAAAVTEGLDVVRGLFGKSLYKWSALNAAVYAVASSFAVLTATDLIGRRYEPGAEGRSRWAHYEGVMMQVTSWVIVAAGLLVLLQIISLRRRRPKQPRRVIQTPSL